MGLAEHCFLLRDYYAKHAIDAPDWLGSDADTWQALEKSRAAMNDSRENLTSWDHDIQITNGNTASIIRARPGEKLKITASGRIWNANGDNCIHQLLLILEKEIIAELSDGVPSRGRNINKTVEFNAPAECGAYMFWKKGDLQYSMRDARRNCENGMSSHWHSKYPGSFVGWLIVE